MPSSKRATARVGGGCGDAGGLQQPASRVAILEDDTGIGEQLGVLRLEPGEVRLRMVELGAQCCVGRIQRRVGTV